MNSHLGPQSSTGENTSVFVTPQLFERIVGSEGSLVAIDTPRMDDVLGQFRQFALRSGSSVYSWSEGEGITSLRESEMSVPGSQRLADALRYVNGSLHFGVYLFPGLAAHLRFSAQRTQALALLRQIARNRGGGNNVRKLVIIDQRVSLSDGVDDLMTRFVDEPVSRRRLRLRDGRWVV